MKHISDINWTRFMIKKRFKWRFILKSSVQIKKMSSSWNIDDVSTCEASRKKRVWVEIVFSTQKKANDNLISFIIDDIDLRKNSDYNEIYIF
jgi:hypothetical protein